MKKKTEKKEKYGDDSITVLEGLEAVRKRPGMYIGSTDLSGLHHCVWEIIDNAVDEALNGFGDRIEVKLYRDGSVSVRDYGRGIPCGMHSSGKNTLEVIFTNLHAGGKFSEDAYRCSGGLHGVGTSVANALSSWMKVTSYRDGKATSIEFSDGGKNISPVSVSSSSDHGSFIQMMPDKEIFEDTAYDYQTICDHVRNQAYFCRIHFTVEDERTGKSSEYYFENGIVQYLEDMSREPSVIPPVIIRSDDQIKVEAALKITSGYSEKLESFVNMVHTTLGGTHETGFRQGVTRAFNDYGRQRGLLKKNLEGNDIREGMVAVLSISVPEHLLQFESQKKEKLGTAAAKTAVENAVYDSLSRFLLENSSSADNAIKKMIKACETREALRKVKEDMRTATNRKKIDQLISSKLSPCQNKNGKNNELFLVEGDSAAGSAKQGRDSKFQAILPLRGKTLNPEKCSVTDVLKNEELNTIIHCVGAGTGKEFDVNKIRYDKVIIMSDADVDGSHIQCLLITFFYRFMKPLIEEGHLYAAKPPLYKIQKGEKVMYAYSDDELKKKQKMIGRGSVQRYKGLGEMNASQLWETTMDPENRILRRITLEDAEKAEYIISTLMGEQIQKRKDWINANVRFISEDDYKINM